METCDTVILNADTSIFADGKLCLHVYNFHYDRLQAGKYPEALELAKVAIKWEEKELGNRSDRMVDLYALMAEIYDEVCDNDCHLFGLCVHGKLWLNVIW